LDKILVKQTKVLNTSQVQLPSSKSESNRSLIINALSGNLSHLHNLSEARDTQTMIALLESKDETLDVIDAGTTMRFLTAYLSTRNETKILTGTPRMCQRPIKILVDALREIGAQIEYMKEDGYPPLKIKGIPKQEKSNIQIRGDVSSQYISALLMIAPKLPQGLTLELTGKVGSRPYIEMTLDLMKQFGIQADWEENFITIKPQTYKGFEYTIESDWSGASYWFSMVSLAEKAEIKLLGLRKNSLQGDIRIVEIMQKLGVEATFDEKGVFLKKSPAQQEARINFTDCPDLAQTIAVVCAAKGITCIMTGLESLRIKETDRIAALQNELKKIGASLTEPKEGEWLLTPAANFDFSKSKPEFETYDDHRMAMAFAPLATLTDVVIQEPDVVRKSYPGYWKDLLQVGFKIESL
jgi:3-phosphoshikimate 1-carboxyvinyltransferase